MSLDYDLYTEVRFGIHLLKIESLEKIKIQELQAGFEYNKNLTKIYKKLSKLSTTSEELIERIGLISARLAFYMTLSQKLEEKIVAAQSIINKLESAELKPGIPKKTE